MTAVAAAFSPWTQFEGQRPSLWLMTTLTTGSRTHRLCTLVDCVLTASPTVLTESAQSVALRVQKRPRERTRNLAIAFYWQHRRTPSVVTNQMMQHHPPPPLPSLSAMSPASVASGDVSAGSARPVWPLGGNLTGVNATESRRGHLRSDRRGRILIPSVNKSDRARIHVSTWCPATANSVLLQRQQTAHPETQTGQRLLCAHSRG